MLKRLLFFVVTTLIAIAGYKLGEVIYCNKKEGFINSDSDVSTTSASAPPKTSQLQYNAYDQQKSCAFLGEKNAANIAYLKEQMDGFSKLQQQMSDLKDKVEKNSSALDEIGNELGKKSQELTGRSPDDKSPLPTATGLSTE